MNTETDEQTDELDIITKCDVCGTAIISIGKRPIYLQYKEWQHSFNQSFQSFQRCFKQHFGYDIDKERFEESSKIFFMKELRRLRK